MVSAFEVADVIEEGEDALDAIPDPPPLQLIRAWRSILQDWNYEASAEYLSRVERARFNTRTSIALLRSSPQLRRYVSMLRELEHGSVDLRLKRWELSEIHRAQSEAQRGSSA